MKSYITTSIFCFFALLLATSATAQSLQYKVGTYEDMVKDAEKTHRPFLIIFEHKECQECEVFENTTLKNEMLTDFLNANFSVYKVDAFSYEGIGTAQLFDVSDYPTVMIFNADGVRSSTVAGINDPNEFHKQVKFALVNMPNLTRPVNVPSIVFSTPTYTPEEHKAAVERVVQRSQKSSEGSRAVEETAKSLESAQAAAMQLSQEEAEIDEMEKVALSESVLADVPGFVKYSVKDKKPEGYAIRIGQYGSMEALKAEVAVYEKKWKNQVWVYTQERQGTKQYCLALGVYEDKESAQYIRRLLYQNFSLQGSVILLNDIRY